MATGRIVSPAKFLGKVVGGIMNVVQGNKAGKDAAEQQRIARAELEKQKSAYGDLDTSNLAAGVQNAYGNIQTNFENVYEDLTVNQQQAQFQAEQGAQQRANIMQNLQGAAGGSGIAGLAQAMANQGQLAAQQASASIGQQEAANQRAMAQGAANVQAMEATAEKQVALGAQQAETTRLQGAKDARGLEYDKTTNLLGMASGDLQAANAAKAAADAQKASGVSGIVGGIGGGVMAGLSGGLFGDGAANFMKNNFDFSKKAGGNA
jgi:hypothetical protein